MQYVSSLTARDCNRRKEKTGALWEGRYRSTLIQDGKHRENLLKKLSSGSEKQLRKWYETGIADKLRQDEMQRESFWSDSRVGGDYGFVLRQAKKERQEEYC